MRPLLLLMTALVPMAGARNFDVVIYGGTPAGVAAATSAGRQGVSVALVEETYQIGGLTSGGLAHTDFKTFQSLGGSWKEFMDRVWEHYRSTYGEDSPQLHACARGAYYEPKVAREVFGDMLASAQVTVITNRQLTTAITKENRVASATFVPADSSRGYPVPTHGDPMTLTAKVFIDATYEGDLLAKAGVPFRLGTDARTEFGEPLAPENASARIMATNFRICLSRDPGNRRPITKPEGYDRSRYSKVIDLIAAGKIKPKEFGGTPWPLDDIIRARPVPNLKSDFNDTMGSPISIKLIEETHAWPGATPTERAALFSLSKNRALGMFWFLGNDPALPQWVRDGMNLWGLPLDEFTQSENWPPVLYVREGRRLKGIRTFTQHDTAPAAGSPRAKLNPDSIAIGDYSINSHGTHHRPDGSIGGVLSHGVKPFQIPYGCLVPETISGILAPVPLSASHVGYGSIRMEPTWTALGQAAGLAAAHAVKNQIELRDVPVRALQRQLHDQGAFTVYLADVPAASPYFKAAQFFGTIGYFHGLTDSGTADGFFKSAPPRISSQWSDKPFDGHAIRPDQPVTRELAALWLDRAADDFPKAVLESLTYNSSLTRGDFLNRLFEIVTQESTTIPR